jgi:hypothetical protein
MVEVKPPSLETTKEEEEVTATTLPLVDRDIPFHESWLLDNFVQARLDPADFLVTGSVKLGAWFWFPRPVGKSETGVNLKNPSNPKAVQSWAQFSEPKAPA